MSERSERMKVASDVLLACPFCGSPAEIREASWTAIEYVRCSNRACPVRPSTYDTTIERYNGMTRDEAKANNIAVWNTRHANIPMTVKTHSKETP